MADSAGRMRLLSSAGEWLQDIVVFAVNTDLRMGEILALILYLIWGAVDLSRRTLIVLRSKNGERRTIPLNRTVVELLAKRMGIRPFATELVFWSEAGISLDGANLRRAFRLIVKKAGLVDFHFHDLRHTFATRMVQAGVDLYKVQRLLGHKSPQMTQRYAHHYPESLRDGVDALEVTGRVSTKLAHSVDSERCLSATC